MKHNRVIMLGAVLLAGCTTPLEEPKDKPVVDYSIVVTDPNDEILPPPKMDDVYPNEGVNVTEPVKKYLSRLKEYQGYIDKNVKTLEVNISVPEDTDPNPNVVEVNEFTFTCGEPIIPQIEISERPRLNVDNINDISDSEVADLALKHAKALKKYNDQTLDKITRGVNAYKKYCG